MKFDLPFISVLFAAIAPLLVLIVALGYDRQRRKSLEKPPQSEKLLRPPGYSLAIRLEQIIDSVLEGISVACMFSALAGLSAITLAQLFAVQVSVSVRVFFGLLLAAFAVAGIGFALRSFRRMREAQNIRLGLRGEQAVAEALNEVADAGFRAFHDLPGGENWNIDHVAIGTRGVFLIETKARRRRGSRNGQPEHIVIHAGDGLQFPTGRDTKSIAQAKRNAKWLSDFLTKKTGEPVEVNPLVVLPGWFVEPKGNFPVKVMNATYLVKFLRAQKESIRDAGQVQRIIAALDEKCRTVEF